MPSLILCVEDNLQNIRLVRKILSLAGYEVIEALDAASGLRAIENHQPDLVLMDINLPDMDGLTATRQLRRNPKYSALPIIALTANAMHGDRELCFQAGCNGYVPKPLTKGELLSTVAQFLRQSAWKPDRTLEIAMPVAH